MGVKARIVLWTSDEETAVSVARAALDRLAELDDIMSDYRRSSELMRLCARAGGAAVPISDDLRRVLSAAIALARETDGAFDPTVGPLVRLWRRASKTGSLGSPADLEVARTRVGWPLVRIESGGVRLLRGGMLLDLGGIGKGFAADEVSTLLRNRGVRRHLIDLGGDLVAGEAPPDTRGWRVGLDDGTVLHLVDEAIATSGDTEKYVMIDGVRYSHILDPKTGYGLHSRERVTVIAKTGTRADGLASAISVLGSERGLALVTAEAGTAVLVERRGRHGETERTTSLSFLQRRDGKAGTNRP